jgi:phospholipase C
VNNSILSRRWVTALLAAIGVAVPAMIVPAAHAAAGPARAARRVVTSPIHHVVVLMLENQSFDSVLGFWCNDNPGRCPDGGMPSSVKLANGAVVTPRDNPDVVPVVGHKVIDQKYAIDNGKMDGWYQLGGCKPKSNYACISGYEPSQQPNLTALASKFAISDKFFSLADSPSFGGHLDIVTSNLDGFAGNLPRRIPGVRLGQGWGCDSDTAAPWSAGPDQPRQQVPGCIPDPSLSVPNGGAFEPTPVPYEPTIMDELSTAGKSWKLYTGSCTDMVTEPNGLLFCNKSSGGYLWAICPAIAECLYTQSATHTDPTGKILTNAAHGKLPNFSIISPAWPNSEHNGVSMTAGDDFVDQVAKAIMNGPQWHSTVLFITWDDCGCFYDQVPPPVNADGTQDGPRLPLVIVSPYAKPAYTDTTTSSFASILAYTEHTFGLPALGVNDANAYDLSGAFNYSQAPLKPIAMVSRPVPQGDHIDRSQANDDT